MKCDYRAVGLIMPNLYIKLTIINIMLVITSCNDAKKGNGKKTISHIVCDETINCREQARVQEFLSETQKNKAKSIIAQALSNIDNKTPGNGINKFFPSTRTVFTIEELPGLIFKRAQSHKEALDNSRKAQFTACTVQRCNLTRLVIPKIESIIVEINGKQYFFTAEQMLELKAVDGSFYANESQLHDDVITAQSNDKELAKFGELFNQLAIFSIETNFH